MTSAADWLRTFERHANDGTNMAGDFLPHGFWRDYLSFGWTLQTIEGRGAIERFAAEHAQNTVFRNAVFEGQESEDHGFFTFETKDGPGRGYLRLENGKCKTLFTMLDGLKGQNSADASEEAPFVLIVGGGQGGLALGAQLGALEVPYLIVDKYPRVGDQWRSRYQSLVLHDPVWYDHMPLKPFPEGWPVFTPKDQMADWLESYAQELGLNIWTSTELTNAKYDASGKTWTANLVRNGEAKTVRPTHLVMALGLSGFPRTPDLPGQDVFNGPQFHSSAYKGGDAFSGQNVVVVGANNSAHDIASDLVQHGAKPTMIQRSSTLVVDQSDYCERFLGPLYSAEAVARGITTDKADILSASMPLRLMEPLQRAGWDALREDRKDYYQRLTNAGFAIDFAEDGTGVGMKYRRTASGYYIDVGAAEMVMDGRIGVRSGNGISHLSENALHLENGEALDADAIVYATGYGGMTDWIAALIDQETADRVGPCWGYGSGTKGDPGPWIGEQRNMWMETKQEGLWLTGGNLAQARFFSKLLGLQLAKRYRASH